MYLVGAIENESKYDIYIMNSGGSENHNITPEYFPADLFCHDPIFSKYDSKIFLSENGTRIRSVTRVFNLNSFMNKCIYFNYQLRL